MKLHRIEVQNLNSLYGDHVVDLDDALRGASLFLIHGATGAGKSTLMDAVSLALFGETPRLDAQRGDADADPRNVMSHDAGQCHAQVEFSKLERDGVRRRYRARWSCRRAHRQAEGRLQDAERSLERVEDDATWTLLTSSAKRKDYEPAFDEVLEGFTVHDFKRSMLLAQGQFDALLDAPPEARASILERLTDTSDYKVWGQRAARLRTAHERRLAELEARIQHGGAADPAQLDALNERRQQSVRALEAANARTERLRVAHEAQRRAEEAATELARQIERRREVAGAEPKAKQALERARLARTSAEGRLETATAAFERVRPLAEAALRAEQGLEHARTAAADREQAVKRAAAAHDAGHQRLHTARRRGDEAQAALATVTARRDGRPAGRALVEAWDEIQIELDRLARDVSALDVDRDQLDARAKALDAEQRDHENARARIAAARDRELQPLVRQLESARRSVNVARGDASARDHLDALRRAADRARDQVEAQRRRAERLDALEEARTEAQSIEARAAKVTQAYERSRQLHGETHARLELARVRVEALREAHARLLKVVSLAEHRASLTPGEPCPLCGSETHPLLEGEPGEPATELEASAALLASGETDLTDARREHDAAAAELAELRGRQASMVDERKEIGARIVRLADRLRDGSARLDTTTNEGAEQALVAAIADIERFEAAIAQLAEAEAANELHTRRLEQAAASLAEREAALGARTEQLAAERRRLGERHERVHDVARGLAARLRDFELDIALDSAINSHAVASWIESANRAHTEQRDLHAAVELAEKKAVEAAASVRQAEHDLQGLEGHLVERREEAERAREIRDAAVATAREKNDALAVAHAEDTEDAEARPAARWILEVRRARAEAARCDLAEAQLGEHRAQAALVELHGRLEELEQAATAAHERCEAASEQARAAAAIEEELANSRAEAPDLDALTAALARAQAELDELRARDRELHARWRMVEVQLAKNEAAVRELAAARGEAEPWLALHQLIGRRDGDAFKTFAQALNLARLISRANVHLGRLSDRYRLAQAREAGAPTLEFVVEDLYHLRRTRSPRSLSGGERFLVSLALALGLSDLRTVTMPIDTLLLDEGFGTLDPETLSVALGALQQLRASGRQVGIISHVVGLREQIEAQIVVEKVGDGRSRVRVAAGETALGAISDAVDGSDDADDARAAG